MSWEKTYETSTCTVCGQPYDHSAYESPAPHKNCPGKPITTILKRIDEYLGNGGLFNPELMKPEAVRDLLVDCHGALKGEVCGWDNDGKGPCPLRKYHIGAHVPGGFVP